MIGRRSIFTTILVKNFQNPETPFEVKIQENKNGGIYDVILPAGKELEIRSEILNRYQGRQVHAAYTEETLEEFLTNILNK